MPKRKYKLVYTVPGSHPKLHSMRYETIKACNRKEAKVIGKKAAEAAGGEFMSTYSMSFNGAAARDARRAMRYHNPESFVPFDLKHRHKGRPIKGIRNCPRPKKLVMTTRDVGIAEEFGDDD